MTIPLSLVTIAPSSPNLDHGFLVSILFWVGPSYEVIWKLPSASSILSLCRRRRPSTTFNPHSTQQPKQATSHPTLPDILTSSTTRRNPLLQPAQPSTPHRRHEMRSLISVDPLEAPSCRKGEKGPMFPNLGLWGGERASRLWERHAPSAFSSPVRCIVARMLAFTMEKGNIWRWSSSWSLTSCNSNQKHLSLVISIEKDGGDGQSRLLSLRQSSPRLQLI